MFIPLSDPVDLAVATTGAWTDRDVSVESGYTASVVGVELIIANTGTTSRAFGVRKNGSTDALTGITEGVGGGGIVTARIGVDGAGILEYFIDHVEVDVYLVGYYTSPGAVFFTNSIDKSTATTSTWEDVDVSSETGADTAIVAFFEKSAATDRILALRPNGSSDDRRAQSVGFHCFFLSGLDGLEICEQWINSVAVDILLSGYLTAAATLYTNATDRSTATSGSYQDVAALPAEAIAGIYDLYNISSSPSAHAMRRDGSSIDINHKPLTRVHWVVTPSGAGVVEQKTVNTNNDLYELGYFTAGVGGGPAPLPFRTTVGAMRVA